MSITSFQSSLIKLSWLIAFSKQWYLRMEYNENPSISSSLDSTCSQKMVTITKFLDNGNGKYFKALYTFTKIRPTDRQSCKEKSCLIRGNISLSPAACPFKSANRCTYQFCGSTLINVISFNGPSSVTISILCNCWVT